MPSREPALRPEPWNWSHPRVLIEDADDARATARAEAFRRHGYAVAICTGPAMPAPCPLCGDDGCAAATGADVIVSSLDYTAAEACDALAALQTRAPNVPLVVVAEVAAVVRRPELFADCEVVAADVSPDDLVARAEARIHG